MTDAPNMSTTPLRERIAREIDHEGYWERLDNLNAAIRAGVASSDDQHMELCHVRDEELAGTEDSLARADAILALLTPSDTAGLIERFEAVKRSDERNLARVYVDDLRALLAERDRLAAAENVIREIAVPGNGSHWGRVARAYFMEPKP